MYAPPRWNVSLPRYMEQADDAIMAMLSIEHSDAVANIDEIVRVPGVDMLFNAPGDLALSLGHGNQRDHPAVLEGIQAH